MLTHHNSGFFSLIPLIQLMLLGNRGIFIVNVCCGYCIDAHQERCSPEASRRISGVRTTARTLAFVLI